MFLRLVYIVFTGILLALFVGVGINTFYKGPVAPEYPRYDYSYPEKDSTASALQIKEQRKYDERSRVYQKQSEEYQRNVSIMALIASLAMLVISLSVLKNLPVIADGVLLGSVFTLLYSIGRGFASNDTQFRFIVVTVGVCIALFLGYVKFVKNTSHSTKKNPKR